MPRSESLGSYLDALAGAAPTPGGGAAAALTLAQAAALLCMVCRLTQGKPQAAPHESALKAVLEEALAVKDAAERLADADSRAFENYGRAAASPKDSPEAVAQRHQALQQALADAARVPLAVYALCGRLLDDHGALRILAGIGNPRVFSDVQVAQWLTLGALESSAVNVRVNTAMLKNNDLVQEFEGRLVHGGATKKWLEHPLAAGEASNALVPKPDAQTQVAAIMGEVPRHLFS